MLILIHVIAYTVKTKQETASVGKHKAEKELFLLALEKTNNSNKLQSLKVQLSLGTYVIGHSLVSWEQRAAH